MRISIQGNDHNIRLALPTAFVFNRHFLRFTLGRIRVDGVEINGLSRQQAKALSAEIRRIKNNCGGWTLVEVYSADGEQVTVTL